MSTTTPYFVAGTHTEAYFRPKSFIDYHLNFMSEMFAITEADPQLSKRIEVESWNAHFIAKSRHPLFKEIARSEGDAFGDQFKRFVAANVVEVNKSSYPDTY